MIRTLTIGFIAVISCLGFIACNEDETIIYTDESSQAAAVQTFKLTPDEDILDNLDSVFFSIDLNKGLIYNVDSLPCGTKVTALIPIITTIDDASLIKLSVTRANGTDTVHDYLNNSTDSIDFTNPVELRIVSLDGVVERRYTVNVNVHKQEPDSLVWDKAERTSLPSLFEYPNEQHTAKQGNNIYCLTRYQDDYCMAFGEVGSGIYDKVQISPLAFKPQMNTFTASADACYMLDEVGTLYTSTNATTWTATEAKFYSLYGGYGNVLLGSVETPDGWFVQQYPSMELTSLPNGMPVSGTSQPLSYSFEMSLGDQMLLVGGRKTDGSLSNATWGFDGKNWANISKRSLPEGLENVTAIPYYTAIVKTNFTTKKYPTLIVMGGRKADGSLSRDVYISNDFGFTWSKASSLMQQPDYIPAFHSAQAYVFDETIKARVSKPLEEWECPFIYIFGGVNSDNATLNTVWRGVINRFSYKPAQ